MSKDKLFAFTDDEFITLQMREGDVSKKLKDALTPFLLQMVTILKHDDPQNTYQHDMAFAIAVMMMKVCAQVVLGGVGYTLGRVLPVDITAAMFPEVMNHLCEGYRVGTKGVIDVDFNAQVATARENPEVVAATSICALMVPKLEEAMKAYLDKEKRRDTTSRPSPENKIV